MNFKFSPIEESHYIPKKKKDYAEMELEEILDQLRYGLETDMTDSGEIVPRLSRLIKRHENDDEGRCECIVEDLFNQLYESKRRTKRIKKKIGKIFAEAMAFLNRYGLVCNIYAWSRSQAPVFKDNMDKKEKEAILNREVFPNFRIGLFTTIGRYEDETAEKFMTNDVKDTLNKLFAENNDAYKVTLKYKIKL